MAKRSRLFLYASIGLALTGAIASAEAAPNPFDTFEQMIEQSLRQPMRGHPPKYRAHKPVLVKATPDESLAAPPPGPAAILSPDVPDAVLPLPAARPAEAPSAAMPPLPPTRPPAAQPESAAAPSAPAKSAPGKTFDEAGCANAAHQRTRGKAGGGLQCHCRPRSQIDPARPDRGGQVHGA